MVNIRDSIQEEGQGQTGVKLEIRGRTGDGLERHGQTGDGLAKAQSIRSGSALLFV